MELEESSYDEANAPKIGSDFQADIEHALFDFKETDAEVQAKGGELLWSPQRLNQRQVDQYLAETQCKLEDDIDDFFSPSRNPDTGSVVDVTAAAPAEIAVENGNAKKLLLITQEEALRVLHNSDYDIEKAKATLVARNQVWSAKKREFEPWNEIDVQKFEAGMRFHHKRFRKMLLEEMVGVKKTLKEVMQYYYTWKKLPRYAPWKKRRMTLRSLDSERTSAAPITIDPQTNAPVKFDEFFEFRHFLGLRSRPRIDYSSSSSGTHIWRTTTGGYKRKQKEESTDTDDEKEYPPLEVFDISVWADIDLDLMRAAKRARTENASDVSDAALMLEISRQEMNPSDGDVSNAPSDAPNADANDRMDVDA
jgi:hypothetical protein